MNWASVWAVDNFKWPNVWVPERKEREEQKIWRNPGEKVSKFDNNESYRFNKLNKLQPKKYKEDYTKAYKKQIP